MFLHRTRSSTFSTRLSQILRRLLLAPPADGDPGLVLGRGHQLRSDLHDLSFQLVELQLRRQPAEQDGSYGVGEPDRHTTKMESINSFHRTALESQHHTVLT